MVKLSDFGLSRIVGEGSLMGTMCGTPSYLAPEVLGKGAKAGYDHKVDIWSMGVILYILLSGQHPFDESTNGILDRITQADFGFEGKVWQTVSAEGIDLVQKCLVLSPKDRYSAKQCLQHAFVRGEKLPPVEFAAPSAKVPGIATTLVASEAPLKKPKKDDDESGEADLRPVCKYGKECYRKNKLHHGQFAHPWTNKD